jgi:glycerol kinase
MDIWSTPRHIAERAVQQARVSPHDIRAISITNQRETALLWERASGLPVYDAIVWRCRRSTSQCERLVVQSLAPEVRSRTGLVIDAYFSATKLPWLFEHIPDLR